MIQIYTAFTAYCILALAADAISYKGSLYDFANMISVSLTEKVYVRDLIDRYQEMSEEKGNPILPTLFDF
jgi:hypothetical protein